jgi:hypothetical protein
MGLPAARREAFEELKERLRSTAMPARQERLASAIPDLDRALGGGFPKGTLATLEGPLSSGRWAIAARLLAAGTRRGLAAVIDGGAVYPPRLAAAGVHLERLLIVPAPEPITTARAADALLRSRACSVVALDAPPLRSAIWARLAGLAHKHGTLLLVVTHPPPSELATAAHLRLQFERGFPGTLKLRVRNASIAISCLR